MHRVKVIGPDTMISRMFMARGWKVVTNQLDDDVDLIQFTGGADVSSSYYGEPLHVRAYTNPKRDEQEMNIYNKFVNILPMAGICRGGQLLNVANGGKMYQHVNHHVISGLHSAYCHVRDIDIMVTSDHHQIMIPGIGSTLLLSAKESTVRETYYKEESGKTEDVEALYYPETKCFCYQPHPEYHADSEDEETYFYYLETFLGFKQ